LRFLPDLTAHRGKLLSGETDRGRAVYAATFLKERCIVLDRELPKNMPEFRLILAHEIFHFVWWRLGRSRRREYHQILLKERQACARWELGESSAVAKEALAPGALDVETLIRSTAWKNYVCESFCDTGAWLYAGVPEHRWFRLANRWRANRAEWFSELPFQRI
jgi:hypothetical protein